MQEIKILTAGDSSLLVEFGQEISPEINRKITATVQLMKEQHIEGVLDIIPAFCSLLINYDPRVISYDELKGRMKNLLKVEISIQQQKKCGLIMKRLNPLSLSYMIKKVTKDTL